MANRWDVLSMRARKDKNGNEAKPFYHRIGTMFAGKKEDSFSIQLDSLPIPNERGELWLNVYVHTPKEGAPQQQGNRLSDQINDDMPFAPEWR
jgi:hypothetical protein